MDILASLPGTAAVAPGAVPAPAAPGDGAAFAAALGLVGGTPAAAPATAMAGVPTAPMLPGFGPQPVAAMVVQPQPVAGPTNEPLASLTLLQPPVVGDQPAPLQAVPEEIAPEPWMTPRTEGKAPKAARFSNMPTRIDMPVQPEPEVAEPIATTLPAVTGKAPPAETPVGAPAEMLPEPAVETPSDQSAQPLLAAAVPVTPEAVARALRPTPAETGPEVTSAAGPAAKSDTPAPTPEAEPFTPAAAEPIAREPVAGRAEPQLRPELATAPVAPSASAPVPVQHAAPAQMVAAAAPVAPPPPARASLSLDPGFGERVGVAIARRVAENGDELTVRMEPAELGRIHVKLRFDEQGSLRAVLSAESAAVVEALRRDSGDLARALGDAGVRTDAQSFRFDRGGAGDQGQSAWARWQNQHGGREGRNEGQPFADEQLYRPAQRNGRLDLMA